MLVYKKFVIVILLVLGICNINVEAKEKEYRFIIIGDSGATYDLYEAKQQLIDCFQELTKGVDAKYYDQLINDYIIVKDNFSFENAVITIILGDGNGKQIEGELKRDYCTNREIETKVFLFELFK